MRDTASSHLFSLSRTLFNRKKFIITITIAAAIAGMVLYFVKPQKYAAEITFILRNPLYADRNYLYNNDMKFIDYFASEDDISRLITMSQTDSLQDKIIRTMGLAAAYDLDISKPKEALKLKKIFSENLKIYRTPDKNVVLSYTDTSQHRAIAVANMALTEVEHSLHGYYINMRNSMRASILNTIHEEDSTIEILTDSLVKLRDEYGIYDIINPSRGNLIISNMNMNPGKRPGFAKGLEVIQNAESIKDQIVSDKARHTSLVNQYATGTKLNELPLTQIINASRAPLIPQGPGLLSILAACIFAGFFFSTFFVLVTGYYNTVRTTFNEAGD